MRQHLKTIVIILVLLFVTHNATGEHSAWNCPECGRMGNTGNYCGGCAHPAPWLDTPTFKLTPSPTSKQTIMPTSKPTVKPTVTSTKMISHISNLTLCPESVSSLRISWADTNNGNFSYTILCIVAPGQQTSYTTSSCTYVINDLAPNTNYDIAVSTSAGNMISKSIWMPKAEALRERNYRWNQCRVYWLDADVDFSDFIYNKPFKRMVNQSASSLSNDLSTRNYYLYLLFSITKPDQDFEQQELLVLRTPDGRVYTQDYSWSYKKGYTSYKSATIIDDILLAARMPNDKWELGTYKIEVYRNDYFAGETSFTLK